MSLTSPTTSPVTGRLEAVSHKDGYNYLRWLPPSYGNSAERRPLLLFLHGAGERGSDVWNVARHGAPKLLAPSVELSAEEQAARADLAENFIVVAPQCRPFEIWNDEALLALLDELDGSLHVDPARVYLAGLSLGGFGAWSLGIRHPHRFAALVPICGGGRVADVTAASGERRTALQQLGIWAFHGAKDRVVPLEESQRMIDAVKAAGGCDVRFTVYPETEHDSWTETFANREIYAWLLRHTRMSSGVS